MAAKTKPYEQFGSYILFKKLEADSLSELWRAAKIENDLIGPFVALRRFIGGHRTALLQSAADARQILPLFSGTSFVRHQIVDVQDSIPFIAYEYAGGRSLRHIVDRARGGGGVTPNPIPLDQAVLMAERIALSLATTAEMRYSGNKLAHGALIPQFIWITDDGEVRVSGQQLGKGMVTSLGEAKVNSEIGRYFAAEYHATAEATKASEVYAMGAILFLMVTGTEPPDPLSVTAFTQSVRAAKTMSGQPIPLEIRTVLDKSLILDPNSRYASIGDMKQALDAVVAKQSATTFNLAFYLSTLLKKEMEAEVLERERESKTPVALYLGGASALLPAPAAPVAARSVGAPPKKSRAPIFAVAAVVVVALLAGAGFMLMKGSPQPPVSSVQGAVATPSPKPAPILPAPVLASTRPVTATTGTTATLDPTAQKKAFEDAVNQKMQSEMLKLQSDFNKQLQKKKSKEAPVVTEPPPVNVAQARPAPVEERAPSAAALDERRLSTRQPVTATQAPAPAVVQPEPATPQPTTPAPAPAAAPVIHEGDVVDLGDLDTMPRLVRPPYVQYPAMAMRQRAETSIIVSALVSENGDVIDVHVLRGDNRFGFNEAASRALRSAKFTPGIKDGKRVKVWMPQTVNFKL